MSTQSRIATLSFASSRGGALDLWSPADAGSYRQGNDIGRSRADELVQYMRDNQAPMVLGHVVQAIVARGEYGAIEIGFFNQLGLIAMSGGAGKFPRPLEDGEAAEFPAASLRGAAERAGVMLLN